MKTTKEQQNEWKRLTSSKDPDVNPQQLPTGMWGAGGLLKTFGPDYFDNMNEFDRYVASAAAIQTDQIYSKRGELKVENKDLVKQRYEELKNDPEQLAILQNNYNKWLETGKDTGLSFDGAIRNFVPPPPHHYSNNRHMNLQIEFTPPLYQNSQPSRTHPLHNNINQRNIQNIVPLDYSMNSITNNNIEVAQKQFQK